MSTIGPGGDNHFWQRWASEVTPVRVIRQRWHETKRNLKVGDLVLVHDSSKLRKKYTMAVVTDVHTSQDGMVRSCTVGFRQSRAPTKWKQERSVWQELQRSVQRLTLLLPVEEQSESLMVTEGVVRGTSTLRGSNTHYHPTNPVHDPAVPTCKFQSANIVTSENNQDNWSQAKENSDQAINSEQMYSDTPPDDGDGLANSEDSGINPDIWIESILNPSADVFIPHNSSRRQGDGKRDQDVDNSLDNNENSDQNSDQISEQIRERDAPSAESDKKQQQTEPGDQDAPTAESDKKQQQAEPAKRGRPRKGTRAPTRKSERQRN